MIRVLLLLLLFFGATLPGIAKQAASAPSAGVSVQHLYRISGLRAQLFYDYNGAFSKNILDDPNMSLWNTVTGEGTSGGASKNTLVTVELTGPAGGYEPNRKITVTAVAQGKVLLNRTVETGLFSIKGKYYAPFFLYDTGCAPIQLTAKITGQSAASPVSKRINFACGE